MSSTSLSFNPLVKSMHFLVFLLFYSAEGKKMLVVPIGGSHWLSMQIVVQEVAQRGHDTVILAPQQSFMFGTLKSQQLKYFKIPFTEEDLMKVVENMKKEMFYKEPYLLKYGRTVLSHVEIANLLFAACESLMSDEELLDSLKKENFDILLTDPFSPCGSILAHYLSVPFMHFLRATPCGLEYRATQCPNIPSYIPTILSGLSDRMTFFQRVLNVFNALTEPLFCKAMYSSFEDLAKKVLQQDISLQEVVSHAAIWLMRYDFVLENPRPLMPNMVLIGGINCKSSKSLTLEFEEYVNKSGDHGIVVFSLGSMVSELPMEVTMQFADAFGKIPQTVLWRYTGPEPPNLSENTKLVKWLPQNDLLAHSKTRVFITHGGTHGLYEAICSGVPMIMMPLFGDQASNVKRMERHGVGVILNLPDLTSQKLLEALETVINDTRYKERMTELSAIHKDRPIEPLDLAVHWIEFVMRHKGADHLRPAAHDLNWIQYHSLDVIAFLAAVTLVTTFIGFKCCLFCCRKLFCRRHQRKSKSE
ncbi:UDP-glucuronosyltransferase 1A1-like isoform X1 [Protopterus annectens]|uniref:UDP-glucuronosyltransferase 1A1-like isoform X1 n=1 Tax=Protopterus annectens TaxID=7888 RepID=UPI001CFA68FE|nr:UDP-glucuronosyltransferase 1A1-like isoform X1 [Protopterus annectens]